LIGGGEGKLNSKKGGFMRLKCLFAVVFLSGLTLLFILSSPSLSAEAQFVGNEVCGSCHTAQYEIWAKTQHAADFTNYPYENQKINMYTFMHGYCQSCHTVGYGQPGGFDKNKPWDQQQALLKIGCENCHGPGSLHVSAKGEARRKTISKIPDPKACIKCHVNSYGVFPTGAAKDKDLATTPRRQSAMLYGINGYEYSDSTYISSLHRNVVEGLCITCHLSPSESHDLKADLDACQKCHGGATNFNINGRQEEIRSLLQMLQSKLETFKKAHSKTIKDGQGKELVSWDTTANQIAFDRAQYNFSFVDNDRSLGVHNYKYARQLLVDSIIKLP
jgi:nitrate/TMAO reductase-like tetraheme cytochrome c subunit